jgi:hypothetical protein
MTHETEHKRYKHTDGTNNIILILLMQWFVAKYWSLVIAVAVHGSTFKSSTSKMSVAFGGIGSES